VSKVTVAHVKMQTEARKKKLRKKKVAEAAANGLHHPFGSYFNFGAQEG